MNLESLQQNVAFYSAALQQSSPATHTLRYDCNVQYLVIDIFSLWRPTSLQYVVVVTVVNDEDPTGSNHTCNVAKGQFLVTLIP